MTSGTWNYGFPRAKASGVTELDLRDVLWPSPMVLRGYLQEFFSVARTPIASVTDMVWTLQYLQYRQIQRSLSDEDRVQKRPWTSSNSRRHRIHCHGSFYLKGHYPKALSCLKQLEYVYLSIGVLSSGTTILADGSDNENMWAGECDSCMTSMYSDEEFRQKWLRRRKVFREKKDHLH